MNKVLSIVIVEPSPLLVLGLKAALELNPSFSIISTFDSPSSPLLRLEQVKPDAVIINPSVFEYSKRLSVRTALNCPDHSALIALLSTYNEAYINRQFDGFIDIYDDATQIVSKLKMAIDDHVKNPETKENYNLSDREIEILVSVATGMSNKEIAEKHNISVNTVISHRKNITRKTGIKSVSGLTAYALLNNLIDLSDVE